MYYNKGSNACITLRFKNCITLTKCSKVCNTTACRLKSMQYNLVKDHVLQLGFKACITIRFKSMYTLQLGYACPRVV